MRTLAGICVCVLLVAGMSSAASKPHAVGLGKWAIVKIPAEEHGATAATIKIRPLLVDGHVKEFTFGNAHDVTDRLFVVQRAYRLNDLLPQESGTIRWRWELGGWLVVDRVSGRVQTLALPAFDPFYSQVSWFRDFAAYCGFSDDASTRFAIVAQLGKRKALLKKAVGEKNDSTSACAAPLWSRAPVRVTFDAPGEAKFTFTLRNRALELLAEEDAEAENEIAP